MSKQARLFTESAAPVKITRANHPNPMVRAHGFAGDGLRCKTCAHLFSLHYNKRYYKCAYRRFSHGAATDHRVRWDACAQYERQTAQ